MLHKVQHPSLVLIHFYSGWNSIMGGWAIELLPLTLLYTTQVHGSASLRGFRPLNPPTLGDFEFSEFSGIDP
jgi:hypothetical protein